MKSWVQQLAEELVRLEENNSLEASKTKAEAQITPQEDEEDEVEEEESNTQ